jgi:molybdenum cofactor cytidylyltransferase
VVPRHYASAVEAVFAAIPVKRVLNAHPQAGQVSSLRLGHKALPTAAEAVLVTLADQPMIDAKDLRALAAGSGRVLTWPPAWRNSSVPL